MVTWTSAVTGQGMRALKIRKQSNMLQWWCYLSQATQEIFTRVNISLGNNEVVQLQDLRHSTDKNQQGL